MASGEHVPGTVTEDGKVTPQQWKWSVLAGMASYIDAGSIVALASGLALFKSELHLSSTGLGVLTAIGPNAIGAAVGSIIGGRLGDKLGRKRIYQYDLLVYGLGILCIAFAVHPAMLLVGTFVVGIAVGADVPTSLALVGELAPVRARGKLLGLTQLAWNVGPVVVLLLAFALAPLDLLGIRIVFLHLFVVAIVTWALRRGMTESVRWKAAVNTSASTVRKLGALFRGGNLRALLWTGCIYIFWGLAAGTAGLFNPYFVRTLGAGSQAASVAFSAVGFILGVLGTVFLFMRFSDRSFGTRKLMWGLGALMQIVAYALFLVLPFTVATVLLNIVLFGLGAAVAGEAFYKVFTQELFPTLLRGTAQGLTFGVARVLLGIWSFFVPALAGSGIETIAMLLSLFLVVSGAVGFFFMPDTANKSLEQIESERGNAQAPAPRPV